jgi:transcriptional regulator with GAF, ATPase, and Fis domain
VLLTGETGHWQGPRREGRPLQQRPAARAFVNITCSALPEQLLESELFGHERGAFTDARQQKRGLFETADGGTVFLDEIGEMTAPLQSKLLRFLEEKTFKRVGGLGDIRVDVRSLPRPIATSKRRSRRGSSAKTCSTGSRSCRFHCRRCASVAATCRSSPGITSTGSIANSRSG